MFGQMRMVIDTKLGLQESILSKLKTSGIKLPGT